MSGIAKDKPVAVLMGGVSAEREVSLNSGKAIAEALRATGYLVHEIDLVSRSLDLPDDVAAVFVALHGEFGEDGEVQSLLRDRDLPFTGSGVAASRLAFDKVASKERFEAAGIPTPAYEVLEKGMEPTQSFPLVVKPVRQGSSVGIHRVLQAQDWPAAFEDALQYDARVLVEQYIEGRELTVGVVDGEALPVLEICAPEGNYDYRAKYTAGLTSYKVPAPIDDACAQECQARAVRAYEALGCESVARADFRMNRDGELYILEVNTIPGFTATSLLPKAARAAGIAFEALCDRIMQSARISAD